MDISHTPSAAPVPAFTVSELNRQVRSLLESAFLKIRVQGEISNFARPASGHWYFTLKDDQAQVRCAMFKNRNLAVRFLPKEGDQVVFTARVSLYEGRGDFQLIGEALEPDGEGRLQQAFEALKAQLHQEGLFSSQHKQPVPIHPRHLGIITSPTGAAVQDILTVLRRRFPALPVTLYPASVQGEEAANTLIQALALAQQHQQADVLIIGRGGGSLEDLWPFNNEALARAVHACKIPVISAVGHEIDFSICDLVADLRAPTPSAAAELVSPDQNTLHQRIDQQQLRLQQHFNQLHTRKALELHHLKQRLKHPGERLKEQARRLRQLQQRLHTALQRQLQTARHRHALLVQRLDHQQPDKQIAQLQQQLLPLYDKLITRIQHQLELTRTRQAQLVTRLNSISPLATLSRGYTILQDSQGHVITHSNQTAAGETLQARLLHGRLICRVESLHPDNPEESPHA